MVTLTVTADVPLDPPAVFDGLVPFDDHLRAAPAVRSVERDGGGGPGTVYRVELARLGTTAALAATVTDLDRPTAVAWQADRPVSGRWVLEPIAGGTRVTVVLEGERRLLDRLDRGWGVLGTGIEALLPRLFRREFEPVLGHLVAAGGGDPAAVVLRDVAVGRGEAG